MTKADPPGQPQQGPSGLIAQPTSRRQADSSGLTATNPSPSGQQPPSQSDSTSRTSIKPIDIQHLNNSVRDLLKKGDTSSITEKIIYCAISTVSKSNLQQNSKEYVNSILALLGEHLTNMAAIDLAKLVRKPKMFNGVGTNPRTWFEEYDFSCELNSWSTEQKVKYFPAFLEGSALRWFKFDVKSVEKKNPPETITWPLIEAKFKKNYFNAMSEAKLGRLIDEKRQKQGEPVNAFISDMRAMIQEHDPQL